MSSTGLGGHSGNETHDIFAAHKNFRDFEATIVLKPKSHMPQTRAAINHMKTKDFVPQTRAAIEMLKTTTRLPPTNFMTASL